MRALLAVGLAISILALALPAWGANPRPATLKLNSVAPLVVKGSGFRPREAVLLTATLGNRRRFAGPIARADGTFVARFNVRITSCTNLTVRAIGGRGSRATLKARPACEPATPKPPATQTERGPTEDPRHIRSSRRRVSLVDPIGVENPGEHRGGRAGTRSVYPAPCGFAILR